MVELRQGPLVAGERTDVDRFGLRALPHFGSQQITDRSHIGAAQFEGRFDRFL